MTQQKPNRNQMPVTKKIFSFSMIVIIVLATFSGCNYKFRDVSIPPEIQTVKINFIENRAQYVNPQLSQLITNQLQQKVVNQTRLNRTNNDDAHYDISGFISQYSISTSGISNQQTTTNRLTVGVHITLEDRVNNTTKEFDISRPFDFSAQRSLQEAEASLNDEIVRNITDEIFNRIFSNW